MELADWLLKIDKVALLTNIQEYELVTTKSTSTSYKMLKRKEREEKKEIGKMLGKKLKKVYSPITAEVHAASDLHQRQ